MNKKEIFERITNRILPIKENKDKPILIAINGIEGSGKTVMA
jgi:uridine kinase